MTPGRHAANDGSFGRSAGGAMLRGVVLIAVAVALGVVLLQATEGSDPFEVAPDGTGVAGGVSTTASTAPGGDTPTTPTTVAPIDPSTITVLVANGSGGVAGLAGTLTEQIEAEGYQTAAPDDTSAVDVSVVYYTAGFEEAAGAVAALFDPVPEVAPLPDPSPIDDLQAANVVLVAAADLAPE